MTEKIIRFQPHLQPKATSQLTPQPSAAHHTLNFLAPGKIRLAALPPLSIYLHFPWCVRKCPYCDFNSHESTTPFPEQRYLDALRADMEAALPLVWGRRIHSIFIGGGTPSLLSAAGLDALLADVRARFVLEADAEITLEANPGTFEAEKFAQFRASGINRLSIGIQTFNDTHLQALGRIHDASQAQRAIEIAQRHFDNFNLDVMFALPNQTLAQCEHDINTALSFAPTHISAYHLTLEPNTVFAKYPPPLPDDDSAFAMQENIQAQLAAAGFEAYEVSAYAQPGRRSQHNLNYWRFGDYLGLGAGAHSKLSFPERIVRQVRYAQPESYMKHALMNPAVMNQTLLGGAVSEQHEVAPEALGFEFMLNALRLKEGVPTALFSERTGLPLTAITEPMQRALNKGLLTPDPTRFQATELGQRFLNDLQALFLPDKNAR